MAEASPVHGVGAAPGGDGASARKAMASSLVRSSPCLLTQSSIVVLP